MKLELSDLVSAFLPLWKIKTTKLLFVVHIFIRALNKSLSLVQINAFFKKIVVHLNVGSLNTVALQCDICVPEIN